MSNKINIGVVGAGIYGHYHINTYTTDNNVNKVVFCDTNEERLQATEKEYNIKGYPSVKEMIKNEELDAVSIATPDPYHYEPMKDAILGGIKNILVEKPLATTVEEAEELVKLAKDNNVRVAVDFHKRWDPAYLAIKKDIENNKDKIVRGYMALDDIIDVPLKWFNWTEKSSPAWFLGVHCYDLIRFITESEVKRVYAVGNKQVLVNKDCNTYDSMQAILEMEDGSNWTVENSWILPNSFPKSNDGQLIIISEKGYYKNESYRGLNQYNQDKASVPNYLFMNFTDRDASGFGVQPMKDFVTAVINNTQFIANAFDGIQATRVAEAVHRSILTKEVISL